MNIEVKDVVGLKEPLEKLIDVVSKGIGTVYRPRAMRNEADAEAYRIKTLAEANAQAINIETIGRTNAQLQRVAILSNKSPEIVERAKARLLTREIEAQLNVEAIVDAAAENLPRSVSDQPISEDWRRKFFIEAENVCDHDLQQFWGKLLAGEIASPGRFSLRTLDVLKHLTKSEAELFVNLAKLCTAYGQILKVGNTSTGELFGQNYGDLLQLKEAGLLHEGDQLQIQLTRAVPPVTSFTTAINGVFIQCYHENHASLGLNFPISMLTKAGRELLQLLPNDPNESYLTGRIQL